MPAWSQSNPTDSLGDRHRPPATSLHNLLRDALLDGSFIHIDETVVQVLKELGKKPTSNSYIWMQTGGPHGKQVVLFDYDPSLSAQAVAAWPTRQLQ